MLFPRNGILSIWLCVLTSGCASFETEIPPEWVLAPQKTYPVDQYLVGMGEGQSRDQAEKRAYASVARIFSAKVQAKSLDHELYTIKERNSRLDSSVPIVGQRTVLRLLRRRSVSPISWPATRVSHGRITISSSSSE